MKVIVALFDSKAELFMQPMFVPSVGVAYRSIQDEAGRGGDGNVLASHGSDFELYHLGAYDEESGVISPLPKPSLLVSVSALLTKE